MTTQDYLQIAVYLLVLLALVKPLGAYMARIYQDRPAGLNRWPAGFEGQLYRLCGIDPRQDMRWMEYTLALLVFNLLGLLPLNPQGLPAASPDSAFNTAVSFTTNTNWQGYGGETTMSLPD